MNNISGIRSENKSLKSPVQHLNFFSELVEDGYDLRFKITGTSMSPCLGIGSFVTLSRVPVSKLRIGDIVFCQCNDGSFKLHRLIQIDNDSLITKGDALGTFDAPFKKTDYKAKVVRIEHHCAHGVMHRNLENQSARIVNYLIARYHHLKIYFFRMYIRLKPKPA